MIYNIMIIHIYIYVYIIFSIFIYHLMFSHHLLNKSLKKRSPGPGSAAHDQQRAAARGAPEAPQRRAGAPGLSAGFSTGAPDGHVCHGLARKTSFLAG